MLPLLFGRCSAESWRALSEQARTEDAPIHNPPSPFRGTPRPARLHLLACQPRPPLSPAVPLLHPRQLNRMPSSRRWSGAPAPETIRPLSEQSCLIGPLGHEVFVMGVAYARATSPAELIKDSLDKQRAS